MAPTLVPDVTHSTKSAVLSEAGDPMDKYKPVSKAEFDAFIANYPRKLDRDVFGAFDPPLVTYNDFTLGDWPKSSVAKYLLIDERGGDPEYGIVP
jgi:hypothetical protein